MLEAVAVLLQSLFHGALNQGGFSGKFIPPGRLSATFGSCTLLLFELGSLTLDLLCLCAFQIALTSSVSGGEICIQKMDKIPPSFKISCSGFVSSMACSSHLVPSAFPCFALFSLWERLFNSNTQNMLIANWNLENCSGLFLGGKKSK